jgi:hypothetical protein
LKSYGVQAALITLSVEAQMYATAEDKIYAVSVAKSDTIRRANEPSTPGPSSKSS